MTYSILHPALVLIIWTLIVALWLYFTRLPAIFKIRPNFNKIKNGAQLRQVLPEKINWVADNYNHLHEQPVIFYALCFILHFTSTDHPDSINTILAWTYVFIRIIHSLWQGILNIVPVRFALFICGTVTLMILAIRSAFLLF